MGSRYFDIVKSAVHFKLSIEMSLICGCGIS